MKIVHIVGYFVPELGYQEYYLAKEHKKMGHDVYVITSDMFYPFPNVENMLKEAGIKNTSRKREPGVTKIDGITVYRLPHMIEFIDFILPKSLKKTLKEIKPDIVFAHESRQGFIKGAAKLKEELGYRFIVDQHDFYHNIPGYPLSKRILRKIDYTFLRNPIVDYCFKKADKVVAVTEETKKYLLKTHKKIKDKLVMIPLGVNSEDFHYKEEGRKEVRERYDIKEDEIVFLFAGTIVRRKGIELLINAFSEIDNTNSKLLIAGTGDETYMKELKYLTKQLKIEEKAIFPGFINKKELPDFFSAADVGVWPGNNSIIIMEAMACKLPIIMVDLQLTHLIDYDNGLSFKENDKETLKKHMKKLAEDSKLRKSMSENSYNGVMKDYSYKEIAKRFLDLA